MRNNKTFSRYSYCYWILVLLYYIPNSYGLECYVCTDQEKNQEKCLTTIKTCEQGQDVCLTEISWGSTPYWSQGAKKQFYISKRCSTKRECERIHQTNMPDCTHIWYQDWKCSECCQGDKCNSFIMGQQTGPKMDNNLCLCNRYILATFTIYDIPLMENEDLMENMFSNEEPDPCHCKPIRPINISVKA